MLSTFFAKPSTRKPAVIPEKPMRPTKGRTRWTGCGWLILVCWAGSTAQAEVAPSTSGPIFSIVGEKAFTTAPDDTAVVRRQPIEISWSELDRWADTRTKGAELDGELRLPLFDRWIEPKVDSVFKTPNHWALTAERGQIVLIWGNGLMHGSIRDGNRSFRVRTTPEGPVLEQVDLSSYPLGVDALSPPSAPVASDAPKSLKSQESPHDAGKESGERIDLLVLYTENARASNGDAALRQLIELGVVETNTAFLAANVDTQLRLVGLTHIDYLETGEPISTHLTRLTEPADGYLDEAHELRNQFQADLVVLIGASTLGGCGVAWQMNGLDPTFESRAFSYTAARCISPNYTLGHEIGHNLGNLHAPDDVATGVGAFPFSQGYKDPDNQVRTMMAYGCPSGCVRLLRWSSPLIDHNGIPLGTDEQDNARSLRATRELAANFRQFRRFPGGTLGFAQSEGEVGELDGTLSLAVERQGTAVGEVAISWTVSAQSAQAGEDFSASSGVLQWPDGDAGARMIEIPILNDRSIEEDETFLVELSAPSANANLGDITAATVTIVDNDLEPYACVADEEHLCLGEIDPGTVIQGIPAEGRFEIGISWRDPTGQEAGGKVVEAGEEGPSDSGLFWFFTPDNWELLIKVLDGCVVNDHFWVLFAAGTDVEYELRITDTVLGEYRVYRNAQGNSALAISDTEAFPSCS